MQTCKGCHRRVKGSLNRHFANSSPACRNRTRLWEETAAGRDIAPHMSVGGTLPPATTHPVHQSSGQSAKLPQASGQKRPQPRPHGTHIERLEQDNARHGSTRRPWIQQHSNPPKVYGERKTSFERFREAQEARGLPPCAPYESLDEWEMVQWLLTSGSSQKKIDEYLKIPKVWPQLLLNCFLICYRSRTTPKSASRVYLGF